MKKKYQVIIKDERGITHIQTWNEDEVNRARSYYQESVSKGWNAVIQEVNPMRMTWEPPIFGYEDFL